MKKKEWERKHHKNRDEQLGKRWAQRGQSWPQHEGHRRQSLSTLTWVCHIFYVNNLKRKWRRLCAGQRKWLRPGPCSETVSPAPVLPTPQGADCDETGQNMNTNNLQTMAPFTPHPHRLDEQKKKRAKSSNMTRARQRFAAICILLANIVFAYQK